MMWCVCRQINAPTVDTLEMDISPQVNQINLMTGNFLTMFEVPYTIQVFAENGIGEGAGSNTIPFTRIQSTYIAVCICSTQYRKFCNLRLHCTFSEPGNCVPISILHGTSAQSRDCAISVKNSVKFSSCIEVRSVPKELLQLCRHHQRRVCTQVPHARDFWEVHQLASPQSGYGRRETPELSSAPI